MPVSFNITSDPNPQQIETRLLGANKAVTREQRQMMERQARRFLAFDYAEAPKKTGKYASEIKTKVFAAGDVVGFEVRSPSPLGTFIQKGTREHPITAVNAKFLRFYWPKVGKVVYFKSVNHPGTKPNRFHNRALQNWLPGAKQDLGSIAKAWTIEMRGGR